MSSRGCFFRGFLYSFFPDKFLTHLKKTTTTTTYYWYCNQRNAEKNPKTEAEINPKLNLHPKKNTRPVLLTRFRGLKTVGRRFQPIRSVQEVVVEVDAGGIFVKFGGGKSVVRGPIWVYDWKKIPTTVDG